MMFAERLRQQPDLAWIGYENSVSVAYVRATRRSGDAIRLYTAHLDVLAGVPVEEEIAIDRARTRVSGSETEPCSVRERQ